jgi:hypothetical protein
LTPQTIDDAWACVAANVVKNAADKYEAYLGEGKGKEEALEMCSQERFVAAKVSPSRARRASRSFVRAELIFFFSFLRGIVVAHRWVHLSSVQERCC